MSRSIHALVVALAAMTFASTVHVVVADDPPKPGLFDRSNLVAWCIVPFDAKKRGPVERVEMLERLGFRKYAYDWRDEHLPTFPTELDELAKHKIELTAIWFPGLDKNGQFLLNEIAKRGIKTQLWVTGGGEPTKSPEEQAKRVEAEAARIRPIAEAAAKIGCTVGLYNHGGWFGEPENQLAILEALKLPNVGIVYNLHHGHDHLDRFPALLEKIKPHLYVLNLNGMVPGGDRVGRKIVVLGQGPRDLGLMKTIASSGYTGPIGILGHTQDDVEARLSDNLDGLDWLVPQLDGKAPGPQPKPRTEGPGGQPAAAVAPLPPSAKPLGEGRFGKALDTRVAHALLNGRPEFRSPPLTVDAWVRASDPGQYHILVASEPKSSGTHWEVFTTPGSGALTAYFPGSTPDHAHSTASVVDGKWHHVAFVYEPNRVRLYVDAKLVTDTRIEPVSNREVSATGLGIGTLVEHGIGSACLIDELRIRSGAIPPEAIPSDPPVADDRTLALWHFEDDAERATPDSGSARLHAPLVAATAMAPPAAAPARVVPPPGPQLRSLDDRLTVRLIDRSDDDALMAIKVDGTGRLFVGGREAVFTYAPLPDGSYGPRTQILKLPQDSIVIGIEYRGQDLYVLTGNALYLVEGGRIRTEGLTPKRLLWGIPLDLHVSFHCMAWGPEGDLYLNHGDPLLNYGDWSRPDHSGHWTLFPRPEGTKVPYNGAGAVWRIRPDGTNLRLVAGGLRGPVGLAFDPAWNLFTNDNDHESRADQYAPMKLLHVTPGIDFGWPRGWMASKRPDRSDLVEPVNSHLGRGVPCDLAFYADPYLADVIGNKLLMCRWDTRSVTVNPMERRGASFMGLDRDLLVGDHDGRPTGIAVGRGGRLFVTMQYLSGNVTTPHCVSDLVMVTRADDSPAAPFERFDETVAGLGIEPVNHPSWERRRRVHLELLRRGGESLAIWPRLLQEWGKTEKLAAVEATWLTAAGIDPLALTVTSLLSDVWARRNPDIRRNVVQAMIEYGRPESIGPMLLKGLADPDLSVQLAALSAWLGTKGSAVPAWDAAVFSKVAELATSDDTYLRQTASRVLADRATLDQLRALAADRAPAKRLAAVLAAGHRLTVPPPHEPPAADLKLLYPAENPFFKRQQPFADLEGTLKLEDFGRVGSSTAAERWKTLTPTGEQSALFDLLAAALDEDHDPTRLQAAYYLGLLRDARTEPKLERARLRGVVARLSKVEATPVAQIWRIGPLPGEPGRLDPPHSIEREALDLDAEHAGPRGSVRWTAAEAPDGRFAFDSSTQAGTTYLATRVHSRVRQPALLSVDWGNTFAAWQNGQPLSGGLIWPSKSGPSLLLDLQPGSTDLLIRLDSPVKPSVGLVIRTVEPIEVARPSKADGALLAERLKAGGGSSEVDLATFAGRDWMVEARMGDPASGRRLFGALACVKCHAITPDQSAGGAPSLVGARARFTVPHLVESVLLPSAQVASPFKGSILATKDGQVLNGLIVSESADRLEVLLSDGTRRSLAPSEIEERKASDVSPMPAGLVRNPDELRDLLAYLLSERPTPP